MARILVTGSAGFVGTALCEALRREGHAIAGVTRDAGDQRSLAIGDIGEFDDWQSLVTGIDVVIHLAARAHVMRESTQDPLAEFRRVNVRPTARLAAAAAGANVSRFVFVSSIGVNGSSSDLPISDSSMPSPHEPYAVSKYEAEQVLREVEASTGLDVTIVRPPLVYGPGVKGNFRRLLKIVERRVPVPIGAAANGRSFIGLRNLCDLLGLVAFHPAAAGETFVVADGEDVATPELLRMMAEELGTSLWVPAVPLGPLRQLLKLIGRAADLDRLTQSLVVDAHRVRSVTGWNPGTTLRAGIREMTEWYRSEESR